MWSSQILNKFLNLKDGQGNGHVLIGKETQMSFLLFVQGYCNATTLESGGAQIMRQVLFDLRYLIYGQFEA